MVPVGDTNVPEDCPDDDCEPSGEPSSEPGMEPSSEPGNEPDNAPEDYLDLDLTKDSDPNYGREGMFGWHMVFDGDNVLFQEIVPFDEDSNENQEDFNQFLLEDGQWGFGLTMSPSNEDVYKYMFGDEDHPSYELPLFDTRDRQITLRFADVSDEIPEGFEVVCTKAVQPQLYYRVFNQGQRCYEVELKRATEDSFFCLNEGTTINQNIRQINQTFQLLTMKQDVIVSGNTLKEFKAWMNGHLIVDQNASNWNDVPEECRLTESTAPFFIVTGLGREIQTDTEPFLVPNLNARVDNIIMIDPNTNNFQFPTSLFEIQGMKFWYPNHDNDATGTTLYRTIDINGGVEVMDFSNALGKDAYAWWNFEWNTEGSLVGVVEDFSPRPLVITVDYNFYMEPADPNILDFEPSTYYINQNGNVWDEECWKFDDGTSCN